MRLEEGEDKRQVRDSLLKVRGVESADSWRVNAPMRIIVSEYVSLVDANNKL